MQGSSVRGMGLPLQLEGTCKNPCPEIQGNAPSEHVFQCIFQFLGEEPVCLQVFKQTSIFNVKSALANNHIVAGPGGGGEELLLSDDELSDSEGWQYLRSFWSGGTGTGLQQKLYLHRPASLECREAAAQIRQFSDSKGWD